MNAHRLTPDWRHDWDDFVIRHDDGAFFHSTKWLDIVSPLAATNLSILIEEGGKVHGIFPIFLVRRHSSWQRFIRVIQPIPLSPYSAPLIEGEVTFGMLSAAIAEQAKQHGAMFSTFRLLPSSMLNVAREYVSWREAYDLSLTLDTPEKAFSRLLRRTRRKVRRAVKLGVQVRMTEPTFSHLGASHVSAARDDVAVTRRARFFAKLARNLEPEKDYVAFQAEYDSKVVAGIVAYLLKDRAYVEFNGSLPEYLFANPNVLLYWTLIKWLSENGFKFVDLANSPLGTNRGSYRFMRQFGAMATPLNQYYRPHTALGRLYLKGLRVASMLEPKIWALRSGVEPDMGTENGD